MQAGKANKLAEAAAALREDLDEANLEDLVAYEATATRQTYRPDQDAGRKYRELYQQYESHKVSSERFAAWAKYTVTTAVYRLASSEFSSAEFAPEY